MDPEETGCSASASDAHVLLLPFRDPGHINPLMRLGIRLAAKGLQVTLAVPDYVHAKLVNSEAQALQKAGNHNNGVQIIEIADGGGPPHPPEPGKRDDGDKALQEAALEIIKKLATQGPPVTAIVADYFLKWTSSVAAMTGLPHFVFWSTSATVLSATWNKDALISAGYDPHAKAGATSEASEKQMLKANCIPGFPVPIHPSDLPFDFPFDHGSHFPQGMMPDRASGMSDSKGVICNTFAALELDAIRGLISQSTDPSGNGRPGLAGLLPVGPLVSSGIFEGDTALPGVSVSQENEAECMQWLDAQPAGSVVYVAFGSIRPLSLEQVRELAYGLAASGQRFLWVLRGAGAGPPDPGMKKGGPGGRRGPGPGRGRGPGGRGPPPSSPPPPHPPGESRPPAEVLPSGFLQENGHMCKVVDWAPQGLVLSHPAVGGFFSHCGWNSTLESVCCGVPILGWPSKMDQFTNCWMVSTLWRMGLSLERDNDNDTSRELVEKGVRQLMEGPSAPSLRARAKELAHQARIAYDDFSMADDLLKTFTLRP